MAYNIIEVMIVNNVMARSFYPFLVMEVTGRFGPESFRPWVVSAWVVSAWFDSALGRFGPIRWVVLAHF